MDSDAARGGSATIPIVDIVTSSRALEVVTTRHAPNEWTVRAGAEGVSASASLELDVCGVWVTIEHEGARPVVARRAGWVDLRGHPTNAPDRLDRVGLGPGDAVVLTPSAPGVEHELMSALLDSIGKPTAQLALAASAVGVEAVVVAVPDASALTADALAAATGLPAARFAEPLHPVGSPAAELWAGRPAPPREARLRVPPHRRAVPEARRLLRRLVASWRMQELLDGDLELLATEVVTNAVVHARTDIDVTVTYTGDVLRFDVYDRDGRLPAPSRPDPTAEGGRGLWMVEELSASCGIDPVDGGKRVWFTVAA